MTATLIATWFGCGYAPKAPGTAGSIGGLALAYLVWVLLRPAPWIFLLVAAATTPIGIWAASRAAEQSGRKDPGFVVIDEVLGTWVTLGGATTLNWKSWLAAFVLFRVFDIWKPPPVRALERLQGGTGIVADDLMAGVYGALVLFLAGCFNLY